jgi:hypothetical protein
MRAASAGPMRGRRTSDSAGAVSRSKGAAGARSAEGAGGTARFVRPARDERVARAESTAALCWFSAERAAGGTVLPFSLARCSRTPAPRSATAPKNSRALRSEGVGTRPRCVSLGGGCHHTAPRRVIPLRLECARSYTRVDLFSNLFITTTTHFLTRGLPCCRNCDVAGQFLTIGAH